MDLADENIEATEKYESVFPAMTPIFKLVSTSTASPPPEALETTDSKSRPRRQGKNSMPTAAGNGGSPNGATQAETKGKPEGKSVPRAEKREGKRQQQKGSGDPRSSGKAGQQAEAKNAWEDRCKICSSPSHPSRFCKVRKEDSSDLIKESEKRTEQEKKGEQDAAADLKREKAEKLAAMLEDQRPFPKLQRRLRFVDQNLLAGFLAKHPIEGCHVKVQLMEKVGRFEADGNDDWATHILELLDDVESSEKFTSLKSQEIKYIEHMVAWEHARISTPRLFRGLQAVLVSYGIMYAIAVGFGLLGPDTYEFDEYGVGTTKMQDGELVIVPPKVLVSSTPPLAIQVLLTLLMTIVALCIGWLYSGIGWGFQQIQLHHHFWLDEAPPREAAVIRQDRKNMSFRQAKTLEVSRPAVVSHTVTARRRVDEPVPLTPLNFFKSLGRKFGIIAPLPIIWESAAGFSYRLPGRVETVHFDHGTDPVEVRAALLDTVPNLNRQLVDLTVVDWLRTQARFMYQKRTFEDVYDHASLAITTNGQIGNDLRGLHSHTWYSASVTLALVLFQKGKTTLSGQAQTTQDWGF